MALYAISDLHIENPEDPLFNRFIGFLKSRPSNGDVVVLAGDLFDLFVGSKRLFIDRYQRFFDALREIGNRGVRTYYIQGNHDFLMESALSKIPHLVVCGDEVEIEHQGKRFFVAHGDLADKKNFSYLALRGFLRSGVIRALVKAAPGKWIDAIGNRSSRMSRAGRDGDSMVTQLEKIRKIYRSYAAEKILRGSDFVILGHCHDLDEMVFSVGERQGQYINVGYPRVHDSFLAWAVGEERITRERLSAFN